jgi:hypothetical protein
MVAMGFGQNEVDHASYAEETLRHLVAGVRLEANRSPEYVTHVDRSMRRQCSTMRRPIDGTTKL